MAYEGLNQEQMSIDDYGFSVSVGNIIESSNSGGSSMEDQYSPYGSETSHEAIVNSTAVKRKSPGASNKPRKKMNAQTKTVKTTTLTDDGFGWRKYGQKNIHHEPHPKSYYRCTHHKEENCEARKWVQKESDNPPVYKTTYIGCHTCKNPHKIPQIFYPDYLSSPTFAPDDMIESFPQTNPSRSMSKPIFLSFDSPNSNLIPSMSTKCEQVTSPMEVNNVASPASIPAFDSMMFLQNQGLDQSEMYGNENSYFPSIGSPIYDFGSHELSMMPDEPYYLEDLDSVNLMQEFYLG